MDLTQDTVIQKAKTKASVYTENNHLLGSCIEGQKLFSK